MPPRTAEYPLPPVPATLASPKATPDPVASARFVWPPATHDHPPLASLEYPPAITAHDPEAMRSAAVRISCKSTALVPLAFPPVAVPSGFGPAINAPVPFGVRTSAELVCPACWLVMATLFAVLVVASSITISLPWSVSPPVPSARRMALSTEPAVSGRGRAFAIMGF